MENSYNFHLTQGKFEKDEETQDAYNGLKKMSISTSLVSMNACMLWRHQIDLRFPDKMFFSFSVFAYLVSLA